MKVVHKLPLINDIFDYDVVLVGTGINNSLGNGFQHDIKINFPDVEKAIKSENYGDLRKMGNVTVVKSEGIIFCLCHIHKGGYRKDLNPIYLDYESLKSCLGLVFEKFNGKKIASTVIGGGPFDGNGDRGKIMELLESYEVEDLSIYDYLERDYREEENEKWSEILSKVGKIPYDELKELKERYKWARKHGIYVPYNK